MFIEDTPTGESGTGSSNGETVNDDGPKHAPRHSSARHLKSSGWFPHNFRPRTVRAKIVSLLMVPVLSLMALWGFATVTTAQSVSDLQRFQEVNSALLEPTANVISAIQAERSAVARYLADPNQAREDTVLKGGEDTDDATNVLRDGVNGSSTEIVALDAELPERIDGLINDALRLQALREQVVNREVSPDVAYRQYTAAIERAFSVGGALTNVQEGGQELRDASSGARVVLELAQAREMVAQEDAAMGAAHASGEMTRDEYNTFVGAVHAKHALLDTAVPDLRPSHRSIYQSVLDGAAYTALTEIEAKVLQAGGGEDVVDRISEDIWSQTAGMTLDELADAEARVSTDAAAEVNPFGLDVLGGSGLAVVLGLIGVLLSLVISVQIGRGLVVDLVALRNSAMELAGEKLPRALRRLHTGAEIDVDAEAPIHRMHGDGGEVAEVAEALNAVHRSAIRSAIERAEALSGISAVYVYLARRSQVLLHRQLALLDQMERRIDDPDELEDLFRLDHLTTRMRRLAEGLIILSGATPARGWRKPVPLIDVVRASVAEVEDFTRVDVHDLPEIKMAGSAVADVTHLLAELIENAVVFSPPHTQAHVRGELVGAGLALEIEDRGLGMSPQALEDANRRIEDADQVDLLETDQLGLFVVNRLSHRHNVRVTLQSSPYGGITAVVLVPDSLIDRSTDTEEDHTVTRLASSIQPPGYSMRTRALPPARVAAPVPPPDPDLPSGDSPGNWAPPPEPFKNGNSSAGWFVKPSVDPSQEEPEPVPEPNGVPVAKPTSGPVPGGDQESADDDAEGLPRRVRQASLAPQLREPTEPAIESQQDGDSKQARSPDQARATMAAMRSGWLRGQTDLSDDDASAEPDEPRGERE